MQAYFKGPYAEMALTCVHVGTRAETEHTQRLLAMMTHLLKHFAASCLQCLCQSALPQFPLACLLCQQFICLWPEATLLLQTALLLTCRGYLHAVP